MESKIFVQSWFCSVTIYSQFGAIQKLDSECIVINNNLLSNKRLKANWKNLTTTYIIVLKKVPFLDENGNFC